MTDFLTMLQKQQGGGRLPFILRNIRQAVPHQVQDRLGQNFSRGSVWPSQPHGRSHRGTRQLLGHITYNIVNDRLFDPFEGDNRFKIHKRFSVQRLRHGFASRLERTGGRLQLLL
jgi:hypothetical protein